MGDAAPGDAPTQPWAARSVFPSGSVLYLPAYEEISDALESRKLHFAHAEAPELCPMCHLPAWQMFLCLFLVCKKLSLIPLLLQCNSLCYQGDFLSDGTFALCLIPPHFFSPLSPFSLPGCCRTVQRGAQGSLPLQPAPGPQQRPKSHQGAALHWRQHKNRCASASPHVG